MRLARLFHAGVVWVTCINLAAPRVGAEGLTDAAASARGASQALVCDIALGEGGSLRGVAVDANNQPEAGKHVAVWREDQAVAKMVTDEQGRFATAGLSGGVYTLRTDDAIQVYRLWAPGTAPPHAQHEALFVASEDILRGQRPHPVYGFCRDPLILGLIIAAAIAIPIALHNLGDDDDDDAS